MTILLKRWKHILLAMLLLFVAAIVFMLSLARLETTVHRVHTRLLLPAGGDRGISIHIYSGTGDAPAIPGVLDGPIAKLAHRQS